MTVNARRDVIPPELFVGQNYKLRFARNNCFYFPFLGQEHIYFNACPLSEKSRAMA